MAHTKMKRLCRRLDIPLWQAVGLMESLWHLTARETPRGDVGKLSDEDIALVLDYRGDEVEMLNVLADCGWLDRDPVHRLIVHDWSDHADDAVQMRLARTRLFFANGRPPKLSKLTGQERQSAVEFYRACSQNGNSCAQMGSTSMQSRAPVTNPCAQNGRLSAPPEPEPLPVPLPEPEREPSANREPALFSWQRDEGYKEFRDAYSDTGKPLIDEDWAAAFPIWKRLDFEQKLAVVKNIRQRIEGRIWTDPTFVSLPKNFLSGEWKRPVVPRKLSKAEKLDRYYETGEVACD
jgi:hypothetical protein